MDTKKRIGILLSGLVMESISGCSNNRYKKSQKTPPYVPEQKLVKLKKPINALQQRQYDFCMLEKNGVEVIRIGQTWKFVFPNEDLFDNDTAEINDHYLPVLAIAADFMKTYSKISVEVAGFSNRAEDDPITKFGSYTDELTERQAQSVVRYLTEKDINARLIYAIGRGNAKPVAWDGTPLGRRYNRRVEVTFRYYRGNTAWY